MVSAVDAWADARRASATAFRCPIHACAGMNQFAANGIDAL
jgi:hypothetical protein